MIKRLKTIFVCTIISAGSTIDGIVPEVLKPPSGGLHLILINKCTCDVHISHNNIFSGI